MAVDARIRYTKQRIKKEFLLLLEEMPINKIAVTLICKRAEINRATFYKYYDNPYDLLDKIKAGLFGELEEALMNLNHRDFQQVFRVVLENLKDNHDSYEVIFAQDGDGAFKKQIFDLSYHENIRIIHKFFPQMSQTEHDWLYYFIGEGCNGILNHWINTGMKEDIDTVLSFTVHIVDTLNENLMK